VVFLTTYRTLRPSLVVLLDVGLLLVAIDQVSADAAVDFVLLTMLLVDMLAQ